MRIRRILCPIDFSLSSRAANFYASLLADSTGAEIIYLSVNEEIPHEGKFKEALDKLVNKLNCDVRPMVHDVKHQYIARNGDPATAILSVADSMDVDLMVMGTHGRTGLQRVLHGSVCGKVLRNAKAPVMAVKDKISVNWVLPKDKKPPGSRDNIKKRAIR